MKNQSILNKTFDKVYVLSLENETEKREKISKKLNELNIEFDFFNAVNGYDSKFNLEWEFYSKRPISTYYEKTYRKKFIESRGAWGCLKSYYEVFKTAIKMKYESILVLEDDILFCENFEKEAKSFFHHIPNTDWKLIQLGASQYSWEDHMNENYYRPVKLKSTGAFANGYHHSVFPEILNEIALMETPFDNVPIGRIFETYPESCFVSYPNLIIADVRDSNIRGSRDMVEHAKKMKWDLNLFEIDELNE